jgi:hypothetical protein
MWNKFEAWRVLTSMIFHIMAPCCRVGGYQCFGGSLLFHLHPRRLTEILIFIAVKDLISCRGFSVLTLNDIGSTAAIPTVTVWKRKHPSIVVFCHLLCLFPWEWKRFLFSLLAATYIFTFTRGNVSSGKVVLMDHVDEVRCKPLGPVKTPARGQNVDMQPADPRSRAVYHCITTCVHTQRTYTHTHYVKMLILPW